MTYNATDSSYVSMTLNITSASPNASAGGGDQFAAVDIHNMYLENAPVGIAVDRIASLIFYCIGIPCNPLCAFIWLGRQTRRSNSSAIYLGALSISHEVFLILHIFIELKYAWGVQTFDGYVTCELFFMLFYSPQYLAPLLVLSFTVERYIAVCYPFVKEKYCTVKGAVVSVLALTFFCLCLGSVQAYMWTYDTVYQICNHREVLQTGNFVGLWTWITELIIFGIAPLAALVFNILVIREIRSITTRGPAMMAGGGATGGQNQASTVTLLTVSFYLIITWLSYTIVFSLEREFPVGDGDRPQDMYRWKRHFTYYTVRKFMEEVALSNSACYFFIYYLTGNHFRERVKELLCHKRCCPRLRGSGSASSNNGRSSAATKHYIAVPSKANNGHNTCVTNV